MRKALAYPYSRLLPAFLTSLLVFHAIQWACYYLAIKDTNEVIF